MEKFRDEYRNWLAAVLADGIPPDVAAFAFNLFEHQDGDSRFGVEFIGASEFDRDDSDWACAEVWEPVRGRSVPIPASFSGESWETCLERMTELLSSLLSEQSDLADRLRSVRCVGVGFVDGELVNIWME